MTTSTLIIENYPDIDRVFKALDVYATKSISHRKKVFVQYSTDESMSKKQRGALHVWCEMVAQVLNDNDLLHEYKSPVRGIDMQVDWTMYMIKDMIYKPVLAAMTGKMSTEEQTTVEPSSVAETIARSFAVKGVVLPEWPTQHNRGRKACNTTTESTSQNSTPGAFS